GGFLIDPYFIDSISDRDGKEIYKAHPVVACRQCPDRLIADARTAAAHGAAEKTPGDGPKPASLAPIARAQAATAPVAPADPTQTNLAPRVLDEHSCYL